MLFWGENNTEVRTFLARITFSEILNLFRIKATSSRRTPNKKAAPDQERLKPS